VTITGIPKSIPCGNPFIDPDGYQKYVAQKEQAFLVELAKQKAAAAK
jgi:hypothetical protein